VAVDEEEDEATKDTKRGLEQIRTMGSRFRLLTEYLYACMEPFAYYTVEVPSAVDRGDTELVAFQLLDFKASAIVISDFQRRRSMRDTCRISAQVFEIWGGSQYLAPGDAPPWCIQAYAVQPPGLLDLVELTGIADDGRHQVRRWEVGAESLIAGCVSLSDPQLLQPTSRDTRSKSYPVYALLDILAERGYEPIAGEVRHTKRPARLQYDCRTLATSRSYLSCVVHSSELFAAKVTQFTSGCSSSWYDALMHCKRDLDRGLKRKDLKALMGEATADATIDCVPDLLPIADIADLPHILGESDEEISPQTKVRPPQLRDRSPDQELFALPGPGKKLFLGDSSSEEGGRPDHSAAIVPGGGRHSGLRDKITIDGVEVQPAPWMGHRDMIHWSAYVTPLYTHPGRIRTSTPSIVILSRKPECRPPPGTIAAEWSGLPPSSDDESPKKSFLPGPGSANNS
jgi:hypothetical protein